MRIIRGIIGIALLVYLFADAVITATSLWGASGLIIAIIAFPLVVFFRLVALAVLGRWLMFAIYLAVVIVSGMMLYERGATDPQQSAQERPL